MPRYIDVDALGIGKAKREIFNNPEYADGWNSAIDLINNAPTADVVERKKGKWMSSRPDAPMFGFHYCSICGRKRTSPQDNFCPNCGAEMRERRGR